MKVTALVCLFMAAGVSISGPAFAQDLDFQGYRKFLMSGDPANKKLAIQTTCTSAEGEVFRIGQAGYDDCLNEVRRSLKEKQSAGGEKSESLNVPTTAPTIHIGG